MFIPKSSIEDHQIFNELDKLGILLGLKRLDSESNALYKRRLLSVFTDRSNSTRTGLLNGITRELGLDISDELAIVPTASSAGAIAIKGTKLCLYSDYYAGTILEEYDTWDIEGGAYTLAEVIDVITNSSLDFSATLLGDSGAKRASTLLEGTTVSKEVTEILSGKGVVLSLRNKNIVEGCEYIFSNSMRNKVASADLVLESKDYFIDHLSGTITCNSLPEPGSYIRYKYTEDELILKSSPVIIGNVQSQDLREKMFEQVAQPNGQAAVSGRVTHFGADIINELLSVKSLTYKE